MLPPDYYKYLKSNYGLQHSIVAEGGTLKAIIFKH